MDLIYIALLTAGIFVAGFVVASVLMTQRSNQKFIEERRVIEESKRTGVIPQGYFDDIDVSALRRESFRDSRMNNPMCKAPYYRTQQTGANLLARENIRIGGPRYGGI